MRKIWNGIFIIDLNRRYPVTPEKSQPLGIFAHQPTHMFARYVYVEIQALLHKSRQGFML